MLDVLRSSLFGLALLACLPAHAVVQTIWFDDDLIANFAEIDDPRGVTFSVDPAGFASYGTGFAFGAEFAQGPVLQLEPGAALTMTFDVPVSYLQFGILLDDTVEFSSRVSVALYTPSGLEVFPFESGPAFSGLNERQFTAFADQIGRVVVAFGTSFESFDPLAIDNLVFQPVPEPGTYALLAAGLLLLAWVVRQRRAASGRWSASR